MVIPFGNNSGFKDHVFDVEFFERDGFNEGNVTRKFKPRQSSYYSNIDLDSFIGLSDFYTSINQSTKEKSYNGSKASLNSVNLFSEGILAPGFLCIRSNIIISKI